MKGASERIEQQLAMVRMLQASGLSTYCREVTSGCGPTMIVEGREVINCISNSYMGFSVHPKVIEAARQALSEYGMGIGGSPLACGTTRLHNRLAEVLAEHYGKEDALVFASGYKALAGTIQGLLSGKGDMALLDSLAHRSIIDGCALARCKMRSFKHNDANDLAILVDSTKGCEGHRMVIVDSVYSMDGDVAPLPRMVEICRPAGVTIMIDEAHAMGILGKNGRGLMEHFDLPGGADVVAGTFSKFAGAVGGFCAASRDVIEYLRYFSSPYVFSAALPPATTAAVLASFELLHSEPQWLERLWENVRYMLAELKKLGFDTGTSCTPCIPIFVRDTEKVLRLCRVLLDRGLYCSPVIHPGVPLKQERIRMGLMASHTREHLDRALEILRTTGREFELIP
jgi:8-amino-7-oxononanoate synthase